MLAPTVMLSTTAAGSSLHFLCRVPDYAPNSKAKILGDCSSEGGFCNCPREWGGVDVLPP